MSRTLPSFRGHRRLWQSLKYAVLSQHLELRQISVCLSSVNEDWPKKSCLSDPNMPLKQQWQTSTPVLIFLGHFFLWLSELPHECELLLGAEGHQINLGLWCSGDTNDTKSFKLLTEIWLNSRQIQQWLFSLNMTVAQILHSTFAYTMIWFSSVSLSSLRVV